MRKIISFIQYNLIILCFFGTTSVQCTEHSLSYDSDPDNPHLRQEANTLKYDLTADFRLHRFTHGDIIYVYGTSTSGKTTFTRKLAKLLPEYTLVPTRDLKAEYSAKIINEVCPEEYAYVSKFISIDIVLIYLFGDILSIQAIQKNSLINHNYEAIVDNLDKIKSKNNLLKSRYNPIEQAHYVFNHVFMLSQKNINVIFDNLDALEFFRYMSIYNIHCPLHSLLMYCPPNILLERVMKRNSIAIDKDLVDKRSLMRPLETFINIYKSTENELFIDEIQRDFLIETFRTAYSASQGEGDNHPMSKLTWQQIINSLDSNFGINTSIKIESKYPYCMLLDSSKETAETLALRISQLASRK